jgi:hypothetical protein
MSHRYTTRDLMAAIIQLGEATAHGLEKVDRRFDSLEYRINKRFDSVDLRFDAFERRLHILEQGRA